MNGTAARLAIVLFWVSTASAVTPGPLTSLRAIHALTNDQAGHALPVAFEATVTYYRGYEHTLFVQDGDAGIYVNAPDGAGLLPGDRVLIRGTTQKSFNPFISGASITLLRHGTLPQPAPATFDQMIRAQADCRLVTVRGVLRSADFMTNVRFASLQLLTEGGYFDATVDGSAGSELEDLLDAEVQLTGVASETFDSKMQVTGILLHIPSLDGVRILKRADKSPWTLPLTPMDQVLGGYHVHDTTSRVRVHGTITYYEPGSAVLLQDGSRSVWIATQTREALNIGDLADATGFPDVRDGFLNLVHGEVRDSFVRAPIEPLQANWDMLTTHGNQASGHHYDLVSIEGQVVTQVQEPSQDEYVLATEGKLFSAIYRHLDGPPPFDRQIAPGSRVRVTGICVLEASNPFVAQVPFNILIRNPDDVTLIANPTLLNVRNLIFLVVFLLALMIAGGAREWAIERRVRHQTAALAYVERRRGHILEDINGARPLEEVLVEITELVSFRFRGAPCWCRLADGAVLGNCPPRLYGLRVSQQAIPSRDGASLGALSAAFDSRDKAENDESEALLMAARLAGLAIETRGLYTDLRHRSEFDLLTCVHNRFSLENRLDAQIQDARQSAGVFGLIYIDLDGFKQINDRHGHQAGDRYLQEVSLRMKQQLRAHDLLARIGGDEFAALAPLVRCRADVEEIAQRLDRCFDEPFRVDDISLRGSASIGFALYPENGLTKDALFSTADTAMYAAKNRKREIETAMKNLRNSEKAPGTRA